MESFKSVVLALRDRYLPYHEGRQLWQEEITGLYTSRRYTYCSPIRWIDKRYLSSSLGPSFLPFYIPASFTTFIFANYSAIFYQYSRFRFQTIT